MSNKNSPTQNQVNDLIEMYRDQQYGNAIKGAENFVESWPQLGFGWNVLAASFQALGKLNEASEAFDRATKVEPENHDSFNNWGNILRELGEMERSVSVLEKAVQLKPDFAYAHYNLGVTRIALKQPAEAENSFRTAIKFAPDFAPAHNYLGNILSNRNEFDAAIASYQRALEIMPNFAEIHNNLGDVLLGQGRMDEAEAAINKALEIKPDSHDFLGNLGMLYLTQNRLDEAESTFREALRVQPDFAQNRNNLGNVLRKKGKLIEAETEFNRALASNPQSTTVLHNLGNLLLDLNRLEQGLELHQRVVNINPDDALAHRNLGVTQAILGDIQSAENSYRKSLSLNSDETETFYRLAEVKNFESSDSDLEKLEKVLESGSFPPKDLTYLHYAAGKAYADIGDVDKSFSHYATGASAKRSTINYEVGTDENFFKKIAETFSEKRIQEICDNGFQCNVPVFVVGMPRSGTTLVEQILASHPETLGAGERFDIQRLVKRTNTLKGNQFPDWISNFTENDYQQFGKNYWEGLQQAAPEATRIIDKMPNNFRFPGLIAGMLTGAKIIHVKRNPLDTCLSCFTHLFEDTQNYSYDLGELGKFYRAYWELMVHWKKVLPTELYHEVQYEDIVSDPEKSIKKMLSHCELEWNPACMKFHETKRVVPTASLVQVRQPLYESAIERWRLYERHLQPLIDVLGDLTGERSDDSALH